MNRSSRQLPYLIAAVGGGLLFISLFFDWLSGVTVGVPGLRTSTISTSRTGWEIFSGVLFGALPRIHVFARSWFRLRAIALALRRPRLQHYAV